MAYVEIETTIVDLEKRLSATQDQSCGNCLFRQAFWRC
jgi:hypothetical protein